jgi:hypothetical protein
MPKTEFLQIRITPEDRERLRRAAAADYVGVSTWARRAILQALEEWDVARARGRQAVEPQRETREVRRVAEPKPKPPRRSK